MITGVLLSVPVIGTHLVMWKLIENSAIPYSIVHATQFFEFVRSMADAAADGGTVRFAPGALPAHGGR